MTISFWIAIPLIIFAVIGVFFALAILGLILLSDDRVNGLKNFADEKRGYK